MGRPRALRPAKSIMFHATAEDQDMIAQAMKLSRAPDQAKAIRAALLAYVSGDPLDMPAMVKAVVKEELREHDVARGRRRRTVPNAVDEILAREAAESRDG